MNTSQPFVKYVNFKVLDKPTIHLQTQINDEFLAHKVTTIITAIKH